jgi:hypothetical protein
MHLPDIVALGGGEPEMGTIVTQNVTQDAGKANDYRLLYISAGDVGFDFIVQGIDAQRPPEIVAFEVPYVPVAQLDRAAVS